MVKMMPEVLKPWVKTIPVSPAFCVVLRFDFPLMAMGLAEWEECTENDMTVSF